MSSNTGKTFGKVVVAMGGYSAEREISLVSGQAVTKALQEAGVDAHPLVLERDLVSPLVESQPDRVFVALHGRGGEDGVFQGVLEAMGIPYTGSGVLGSALAMDKARSKQIWRALDLPTAPGVVLENGGDWSTEKARQVIARFGPAVVVKPSLEGSSVGVTKAESPEQLVDAVKEAKKHNSPYLIEHWIDGEEFTVGILDGQALPSIRVETPRAFYDFEAKYRSDSTSYHCPSGLSESEEETVAQLAMKAFRALGCSGWGRVDLMRDRVGRWYLLEVNTVPGMTPKSLVPRAAKQTGLGFADLCLTILRQTLGRERVG